MGLNGISSLYKVHVQNYFTNLTFMIDIRHTKIGLFIKIGQVMSSRPDFMPSVYIDHFSELQDNVPPYPSDEIRSVLSESLLKHHGLSFDEVFETFADEPLGSASIGQVHAATLTDNFIKLNDGYSSGKEVAVKVMHVDAEDRFRNDFKILKVCFTYSFLFGKKLMKDG